MASSRFCLCAAGAMTAAALAIALPGAGVRADLEVTVPAGTPSDWYQELPERRPRYRQVATEKKTEPPKEEGKKGGTAVREKESIKTEVEAHPEQGSGTYQPKLFSGILTDDLPFHVVWVKRKGEMVMRQYPPTITDDIYWTAQACYLRRLLHSPMVPESDCFWYLVGLGDAAREVSDGAKSEKFLEPLASAIEKTVEKAPDKPPEVPEAAAGDTGEDKMLLKLAVDDLMGGDPNSLDPTYAGRMLSLGDRGLPALLACAASPHSILRRNATAILGWYMQDQATEALRKLFREDKDATVRTRAFYHLARRKDAQIVPDLLKQLESSDDRRIPPLAAFGLGMIASSDAVAPLAKIVETTTAVDWDLMVQATIALSRAAAATKQEAVASPALKKLAGSLSQQRPRYVEETPGNPPKADIPDRPEVKNRMLLELATIALARMGDKGGIQQLQLCIAGKWEDAKNPMGHANASGPERSGQCEALRNVCPSSHDLLVDTWGGLGAEGGARLRQAIEHAKTNERLRLQALQLDLVAKDKKFVSEVALGSDSAALKSVAMRHLFNLDEKMGLKVAENIFGLYSGGKELIKGNPKGDPSVVTALEILFKAKKLKVSLLKPALGRAVKEYTYEKPEVSPEGVKPFRFSPPILETVCWMLGSTGDKDAVPLLEIVLGDPKLAARAEATLALGRIQDNAAVASLAKLLDDDDGWIRYNAYLGLRNLTGQDFFADWIFGSKADREEATGKYKELAKTKKK